MYAACAVHNVQLRCTYALRVRYVMHSFAVHTYYARCIRVVHTYSEAIRVHRARYVTYTEGVRTYYAHASHVRIMRARAAAQREILLSFLENPCGAIIKVTLCSTAALRETGLFCFRFSRSLRATGLFCFLFSRSLRVTGLFCLKRTWTFLKISLKTQNFTIEPPELPRKLHENFVKKHKIYCGLIINFAWNAPELPRKLHEISLFFS